MRSKWHYLRGALLLGALAALIVMVHRGKALPGASAEYGLPMPSLAEPPMADAGETPPLTLPPPTPLPPPEQASLGAPIVPFAPWGPMDPPSPMVRLRVRAPAQVAAEKEIEYRLTVENVSRADAHHVVLRDRLPRGIHKAVRAEPQPSKQNKAADGSTDLLWELGTLSAGQHKTVLLVIHPKDADDLANRAYVQFEHGQKVSTRIARTGLSLRIEAPARSISPNPIRFRLFVSNTAAAPADDVVFKAVLPKGLVYGSSKPAVGSEDNLLWKLGRVKPGETRYIELEAIPTKSGEHVNKFEVHAAGGGSQTKEVHITVIKNH